MRKRSRVVYGSPFKIDWTDKEAVIEYCKKFGPGVVVIKLKSRPNYNITHAGREQAYGEAEVIFRT